MLGSKESKSPERSNDMSAHLVMKYVRVTDQITSHVFHLLGSHIQMGSMVVRYTATAPFSCLLA